MSTGIQSRAFLLVVQEEEKEEEEGEEGEGEEEEEGASKATLPQIVDHHQQPVVTMAVIMKARVLYGLQRTGLKEEVGLSFLYL